MGTLVTVLVEFYMDTLVTAVVDFYMPGHFGRGSQAAKQ